MVDLSVKSTSRTKSIGIDLLVALATALLLWAAFAPVGLFLFAWIALVPLLWRVHRITRTWHAALIGYVTGVLFFLCGFHWLFNATRGGYVVVCLILSLYWMLAAALIHRIRHTSPIAYTIGVAAIFTATEFLRGIVLGGFPWLNIGHTQTPFLLLCQIADVTGVAGVTAWVVMVNACIMRIAYSLVALRKTSPSPGTPVEGQGEGSPDGERHFNRASNHALTLTVSPAGEGIRQVIPALMSVVVLTALLCIYGMLRTNSPSTTEALSIALVQSNHIHTPDGAKTVTQQEQIDYLLDRSRAIRDVDVIAWPETTMPPLNVEARTEPGLGGAVLFNRTLDQLAALARDRNAAIVTGGYFVGGFKGEPGKRKATDIRNSVYCIAPNGELRGRYDKIRLVPFAEYVPFQESGRWAHRLMTKFATASYAAGYRLTPAQDRTVFEVDRPSTTPLRVATPICFEDTIAPLVRSFIVPSDVDSRKRADLILNISNDGWFNAAEKALHLQIARFRSIENRVPTARVSNTGQSAFIDSSGRIMSQLDPFAEGVLVGRPMIDSRLTLYTRVGEAFAWACVGWSVIILAWHTRRRTAAK